MRYNCTTPQNAYETALLGSQQPSCLRLNDMTMAPKLLMVSLRTDYSCDMFCNVCFAHGQEIMLLATRRSALHEKTRSPTMTSRHGIGVSRGVTSSGFDQNTHAFSFLSHTTRTDACIIKLGRSIHKMWMHPRAKLYMHSCNIGCWITGKQKSRDIWGLLEDISETTQIGGPIGSPSLLPLSTTLITSTPPHPPLSSE